jgi:hypothetical protein
MDRRNFLIEGDGGDISYDPNPDYEFFFYFVEKGVAQPKFQGCLSMYHNADGFIFSFGDVRESKWGTLKEFLHGAATSRTDSIEKFRALASSNLSIIIIVIHKKYGTASLVHAESDFLPDFPQQKKKEKGSITCAHTAQSVFKTWSMTKLYPRMQNRT